MALPALFTPVTRDGRVLMDGGLVNPLPFDILKGEADITVAIDVSGASTGPGKRLQPTAFDALVSSSQILQRSIVREKLKAQQPDIYIDVEVDEFHVLEFHRFQQMLTAAGAAPRSSCKRQLERVLASQTRRDAAGRLRTEPPPTPARKRLAGLKRLARRRPDMSATALGERSAARAPRVALALGGGSARGLAHIVMLEAFDELGVKPCVIAGTSMGAICGALLRGGPVGGRDPRRISRSCSPAAAAFLKRVRRQAARRLSTLWSLRSPSVVDNVTLFEMLLPEVLHSDFAALKIPFLAIAADFYAIEQVVLDHGPLIPALAASCALPSLARPVVLEGRVLIDGGYVNPVPYDVVMDRADITVAVDVTGDTAAPARTRVPGTLEAVTGATQLLFHSITREKLKSIAPRHLHPARRSAASARSTISRSARSWLPPSPPRTT